jgi:hypothetical protein
MLWPLHAATPGEHMTRKQLEVYREDAKAKLSWAKRHGGNREVLDVLRLHIDRLSEKIEQLAPR